MCCATLLHAILHYSTSFRTGCDGGMGGGNGPPPPPRTGNKLRAVLIRLATNALLANLNAMVVFVCGWGLCMGC